MPNGDGWTLVRSRRRHDRHKRNENTKKESHNPNPTLSLTLAEEHRPLPWTPSDSGPGDPSVITNLLQKVHRSISKLETSTFCRRFLSQIHHHPTIQSHLTTFSIGQMVVYGIGSIDTYEPPRLQLALALLLHKEFRFLSKVLIFDPILSAVECAVMEELGCKVIEVDERARREVTTPTLFYMPHCEAGMYDNLLGSNWRKESLKKMVLLGNSFGEYVLYVSGMGKGSRVDKEAKYVVKASRIVEEIPIGRMVGQKLVNEEEKEEDEVLLQAFNLTSWHFFCTRIHAEEELGIDGVAF